MCVEALTRNQVMIQGINIGLLREGDPHELLAIIVAMMHWHQSSKQVKRREQELAAATKHRWKKVHLQAGPVA